MYGILIQNFSGYNNEDLKNLPPPREDKELEQPDEASVSDRHREGERLVPAIPSHHSGLQGEPSVLKTNRMYTPNIVNHSACHG